MYSPASSTIANATTEPTAVIDRSRVFLHFSVSGEQVCQR